MGLVVKNVEHGMTLPSGQFVPFRASRDYDTSRAGEPKKWASKWLYEDKPRKRKKAAKKVVRRRKTTAKKATAKRKTVAARRNPSWETHPYLVVVKPPSALTNALEGQFKTLAAAKRYAQGLRARGLSRGRVVEIYDLSPGRSTMVSSKQNPTRGPKAFYEVIVSNIGTVWEGSNGFEARKTYNQYVALSKAGRGRAGGEDVSLWKDDEPIEEHYGTATESNPIPTGKWTRAKVMRTKTGDVKVMLPGRC